MRLNDFDFVCTNVPCTASIYSFQSAGKTPRALKVLQCYGIGESVLQDHEICRKKLRECLRVGWPGQFTMPVLRIFDMLSAVRCTAGAGPISASRDVGSVSLALLRHIIQPSEGHMEIKDCHIFSRLEIGFVGVISPMLLLLIRRARRRYLGRDVGPGWNEWKGILFAGRQWEMWLSYRSQASIVRSEKLLLSNFLSCVQGLYSRNFEKKEGLEFVIFYFLMLVVAKFHYEYTGSVSHLKCHLV